MAQPYVKQEWADKVTVINKARLDHIEEGIYQVSIVQPEKGDPGKDGVTPQFQVAEDYIQVSTDNGASWSNLVPLASITGPQGETGKAFSIYKTYPSVEAMNEDAANVPEGSFVLIASTEGDPDNAKLYAKGKDAFSFLTDLSGAQGIQGEPGKDGAPGITPVISVKATTLEAGQDATVNQEGSAEAPVITFGIPRGKDGTNGQNGSDGVNGKNGYTFTPAVSPEGVLSWSNNGNLPNPEPVDIKGPKGDQGERGLQGEQGIAGPKGEKGDQGIQGIQGEKGEKGDPGIQGEKGEKGDSYDPTELEAIKKLLPYKIFIPIRTLQNKVYTAETILKWFGVEDVPGLRTLAGSQRLIYLGYDAVNSASLGNLIYRFIIEYIEVNSDGNTIKLVFSGLNTRTDKLAKYEFTAKLDGTVVSGNSNVQLVVTDKE